MPRSLSILLAVFVAAAPAPLAAQQENRANLRRIPPLGIVVPPAERTELERGLAALEVAISSLAERTEPRIAELLPDVKIYAKAVRDALAYQEFFDAKEVPAALELLQEGLERATQLAKGEAPWTTARGLVVRGYVSRIDGSS